MKMQDDKVIADKLESLDVLPKGYQPNINSKWALLEEAMDERTLAGTRINKKWLRIAACLLILFTSASLYFYMHRTITITLNEKVHPVPSKPSGILVQDEKPVVTEKTTVQ